jgi:hypothetical protein
MLISRMDLTDVGDNPKRLAAALIEQTGVTAGRVPIREIALAADILEIQEKPDLSFEGVLVTLPTKDVGSMLIREDRPETRKRFSIGHELGHFLIGSHVPPADGFRCSGKDMAVEKFKPADRVAKMEVEANVFAAEVLMPRKFITHWMASRREVDIAHVVDLSEEFEVSREAAARRFRDFAHEPVAFVFSKDGRVRYSLRHDDFPRIGPGKGDQVPHVSVTAQFGAGQKKTSKMEEVERDTWIADGKLGAICEQVLVQANGHRLTLLSLVDDDEEEENEDWDKPTFRR